MGYEGYLECNSQAMIDICLESLEGLPLLEQFRTRGIDAILARPLLVKGMFVSLKKGSWQILFDSEQDDISDICVTIGHELGHTFSHDEKFAEEFGLRWASKHGIELGEIVRTRFSLPSETHQFYELYELFK